MYALLFSLVIAQSSLPTLGEAKLGEVVLLDVRVLKQGEPAPALGIWMDETTAVVQAQRIRSLEHETTLLKTKVQQQEQVQSSSHSGHNWIWFVVGGVALGAGGMYLYQSQIK
jgi:hypothetical protein